MGVYSLAGFGSVYLYDRRSGANISVEMAVCKNICTGGVHRAFGCMDERTGIASRVSFQHIMRKKQLSQVKTNAKRKKQLEKQKTTARK
jgi:hypothetical protein